MKKKKGKLLVKKCFLWALLLAVTFFENMAQQVKIILQVIRTVLQEPTVFSFTEFAQFRKKNTLTQKSSLCPLFCKWEENTKNQRKRWKLFRFIFVFLKDFIFFFCFSRYTDTTHKEKKKRRVRDNKQKCGLERSLKGKRTRFYFALTKIYKYVRASFINFF